MDDLPDTRKEQAAMRVAEFSDAISHFRFFHPRRIIGSPDDYTRYLKRTKI